MGKKLRSLILDFDESYQFEKSKNAELVLAFAMQNWTLGFQAALNYLEEVQLSCDDSFDASQLDIAIELLSGEIENFPDAKKEEVK